MTCWIEANGLNGVRCLPSRSSVALTMVEHLVYVLNRDESQSLRGTTSYSTSKFLRLWTAHTRIRLEPRLILREIARQAQGESPPPLPLIRGRAPQLQRRTGFGARSPMYDLPEFTTNSCRRTSRPIGLLNPIGSWFARVTSATTERPTSTSRRGIGTTKRSCT